MEAIGAAASIRLAQSTSRVRLLMIRGISDEPGVAGGTNERKVWKDFAASAAAAFARRCTERIPRDSPKPHRLLWIVVAIAAIALVVLLLLFVPTSETVSIVRPEQGALITATSTVARGTSRHLSTDKSLWLVFRSPMTGNHWLYFNQIYPRQNGDWCTVHSFLAVAGVTNETEFELLVVLANEDASREFKGYLYNPYRGPLKRLPAGARVKDSTNVVAPAGAESNRYVRCATSGSK
jgi:hypothetical protein